MLQVSLQNDGAIRLNAEFDRARGELLALLGPSGSGKTSVLRAIVGLVFQHYALFRHLAAIENVALAAVLMALVAMLMPY